MPGITSHLVTPLTVVERSVLSHMEQRIKKHSDRICEILAMLTPIDAVLLIIPFEFQHTTPCTGYQ